METFSENIRHCMCVCVRVWTNFVSLTSQYDNGAE